MPNGDPWSKKRIYSFVDFADLIRKSNTYRITNTAGDVVDFKNAKLESKPISGEFQEAFIIGSIAPSEKLGLVEGDFPVNFESAYDILNCLPYDVEEYELTIHPHQIHEPGIIVAHMHFLFGELKDMKDALDCIDKYEK